MHKGQVHYCRGCDSETNNKSWAKSIAKKRHFFPKELLVIRHLNDQRQEVLDYGTNNLAQILSYYDDESNNTSKNGPRAYKREENHWSLIPLTRTSIPGFFPPFTWRVTRIMHSKRLTVVVTFLWGGLLPSHIMPAPHQAIRLISV